MRRSLPAILAAYFLLEALPAAAQRAVFVVRHAEKASDANDPGVPLSRAGRARAIKLAALLGKAGVTAISSTDTVRKYAAKDADGKPNLAPLAGRLKAEHAGDVVLVVGHGDTIPPLLKALGCAEEVEIPASRYEDLFLVVPSGRATPTLLRLTY